MKLTNKQKIDWGKRTKKVTILNYIICAIIIKFLFIFAATTIVSLICCDWFWFFLCLLVLGASFVLMYFLGKKWPKTFIVFAAIWCIDDDNILIGEKRMTNEQKNDSKWFLLYCLMQTGLRLIIIAAALSSFFIDGWGVLLFFVAFFAYFPTVYFIMEKHPELAEWWQIFHE